MPCCAIEACGRRDYLNPSGAGMVYDAGSRRWNCYLCYVLPALYPQPERRVDEDEATAEKTANPERDGVFDILTNKSKDPTFHKRNRMGPHWVPHDRRV